MRVKETLRILLVEDNPADVYLMRQALNEATLDYELLVSNDGEDALNRLLGEGDSKPHLILLDLNLPRMDGASLLEAIHQDERLRKLPVILLSSSQAPRDRARAEVLPNGLYLVKPADLDEYLALGPRIYDFWCSCREEKT
jgi:chemotaxis family two-component system response regulator Rcp1